MASILIEGADAIFTGLPGAEMRATGSIRIQGARIEAIGRLEPRPGEQRIDARGCVIYPGLVSTHHHIFQSVLKGISAGIDSPLFAWLRHAPYAYWNKLDEDALRVAAEVACAELLLSGTTTCADHHYLFSELYRFDPAAVLFEVAERMGLRFVLCRGGATKGRMFDTPEIRDLPTEPLEAMLRSIEACAHRFHDGAADSRRRVVVAPTTPPYALHVGELKEVAAAARGLGLRIHSHLSETRDYVDFCLAQFGKRPVHWMADHDWLGPDVWFAHMVHIDEAEMQVLARTGTGIAHCPQSNCRLGSGVAPADRLAAMGGIVSLGVDGAASNEAADMISELHSAWHVHRATKGASATTVEEVVRWGTAGGARALGWPEIGTLAPGQLADIAVFDLSHPRYFGIHDVALGPVISAGQADVRHLLVGGRTVVADGAIPGLDIARLRGEARRVVARLTA